jgi:hypothetical protein
MNNASSKGDPTWRPFILDPADFFERRQAADEIFAIQWE